MTSGTIFKTLAIPLQYSPYSSTSRIVQWLSKDYGKITTLLKGALRPKSVFLGEYALFGTSELLFYPRRTKTLYAAKECALLTPRNTFRSQWKAMQTVSYLSALIQKTTPSNAPQPELFSFYEKILDLATLHANHPQFLVWAELQFFNYYGHAPHFQPYCSHCGTKKPAYFAPTIGAMICRRCSENEGLSYLPCPPDTLAILRAWQRSASPQMALKTCTTSPQWNRLRTLLDHFVQHHFHLPPCPLIHTINNQHVPVLLKEKVFYEH